MVLSFEQDTRTAFVGLLVAELSFGWVRSARSAKSCIPYTKIYTDSVTAAAGDSHQRMIKVVSLQ